MRCHLLLHFCWHLTRWPQSPKAQWTNITPSRLAFSCRWLQLQAGVLLIEWDAAARMQADCIRVTGQQYASAFFILISRRPGVTGCPLISLFHMLLVIACSNKIVAITPFPNTQGGRPYTCKFICCLCSSPNCCKRACTCDKCACRSELDTCFHTVRCRQCQV